MDKTDFLLLPAAHRDLNNRMYRILAALSVAVAVILMATCARAALPSTPPSSVQYQSTYLSLQILPGWTVTPPDSATPDCCTLNLTHGRYILAIDPLFAHAGPVTGGRFSEVMNGQPSVQAVMRDVDLPAGGFECSLFPLPTSRVNSAITLRHLYTDPAKAKANQYGCHFPAVGSPVWFGSYFGGQGPETDYAITLIYNSTNINELPRKNSPELALILNQVIRMLRTLHLKPPVVITKVVPASAPPGAIVTIYGTGFTLLNNQARAVFKELPNSALLPTHVAADGHTLTFVVPGSVTSIGCPLGKVEANEWCVPKPPGDIDPYSCPPGPNSPPCSIPITPAPYHLAAVEGAIWSNLVLFTVAPPSPAPIELDLLYTAYLRPGQVITLRGNGFTATGNTVHIGTAAIPDLNSTGDSIQFTVPPGISTESQSVSVFVSNAMGASNALVVASR